MRTACSVLRPTPPLQCEKGCGVSFYREDIHSRHYRFCKEVAVNTIHVEDANMLDVHDGASSPTGAARPQESPSQEHRDYSFPQSLSPFVFPVFGFPLF